MIAKAAESGFTLLEVLVTLVTGLLVTGAVMAVFVIQNRSYDLQQQMTAAVQTARAAVDMISREIRMAGYDPTGSGFDGIVCDAAILRVKADLRGDDPGDPPDGDTDDPNECIRYRYDSADLQIDRNTGGGNQPFAENIEAFVFTYLDGQGHVTTVDESIRQLQLTVTARTAKPDPTYGANGGHRTYTLRTSITPPNLAVP